MIGKLELAWENFNVKRNFIKYQFQRLILTPENGSTSKEQNAKLKE